MNRSKVQYSQGKVPFSWENKPGICEETNQEGSEEDYSLQKLPPPPCPTESARISMHDINIPLPPCVFHPPLKTSSGRGFKKSVDPFLAAYKECTKSTNKGKLARKEGGWSGLKKGIFSFYCKRSCSVRNDSLVRVSQLPLERD